MAHRGNGKPRVHARDHEHGGADTTLIHYEDIGGPGSGGGGIQFDTSPQEGGFLRVTATTGDITLESAETVNVDGDNQVLISSDSGEIQIQTHGVAADSGDSILIRSYHTTGNVIIQSGSSADITITAGGQVIMPTLPDYDPMVTGALWNDAGTLKVSA